MKVERTIRKLERTEAICVGDIHSFDGRVFYPVLNQETTGQTPNDFSPEREFYRLIGPYVAAENQHGQF